MIEPTTSPMAACPICDAPGELLPDWNEHDRKVKHANDHREPWERCPLAGMIVELHWWNRRPAPEQPAAEWMRDLEKLAKDIDNWADTHLDGIELEVAVKCHAMVRALIKKHAPAAHPPKPEPTEASLGSSVCPICGKDTPHYHAPDVVTAHYSGAVKSASMNQNLKPPEEWMREAAKLIPTTWLDPLLTGPKTVIGQPPYNGHDIEALLKALRERIEKHAPKVPEGEA